MQRKRRWRAGRGEVSGEEVFFYSSFLFSSSSKSSLSVFSLPLFCLFSQSTFSLHFSSSFPSVCFDFVQRLCNTHTLIAIQQSSVSCSLSLLQNLHKSLHPPLHNRRCEEDGLGDEEKAGQKKRRREERRSRYHCAR